MKLDYDPVTVAREPQYLAQLRSHLYQDVAKLIAKGTALKPTFVMIAGGGMSVADILKVPGGSRFIHHISIAQRFAFSDGVTAVSENGVAEMIDAAAWLSEPVSDARNLVAVSAALTTDRYRKGENHAYIRINGQFCHLTLPKLREDEYVEMTPDLIRRLRMAEDIIVSNVVIDAMAEMLT